MIQPVSNIPPPDEGGFAFLRNRKLILACSAVILIVIALGMPSPIAGIDSGLKWLGAKMFSETSSIEIPPSPHALFHSSEIPPCPEPFLIWNGSSLLPVYPVLPIVLNGYVERFFGSGFWWIWPVLSVVILLTLLLGYTRHLALSPLTSVFVLLCGTPLAIYAVTYWEHAFATALACSGVVLLLNKRFAWSVGGALLLGIAPWARPELIGWTAFAWIFAIGFIPLRRWLVALLAIGCGLIAGAFLNRILTGSYLPLQVITNFDTGQTLWSNIKSGSFPYRTYLSIFFGAGNTGLSILFIGMIVVGIVGWKERKKYSVILLLVPVLYVISRWYDTLPVFSMIRANGILFTMPVVLLAPWGWRGLPQARVWLGACIGLLLMVLAMGEVAEGIHWSVRFLLPVAFPMTIAALFALRDRPLPSVSRIAGIAGLLALTAYGVYWYAQIETRQLLFQNTLRSDPALIATDVAWVGGDAAPLLREREIVFLPDRERIGRCILTLKQKNIDRFQFVRMTSSIPLTAGTEGNWSKLLQLTAKQYAPTPEQGHNYRIELYRLTNDSIAYSQLAGELAAIRLAVGDIRGVDDARWALRWNPKDYRPAIELLAFGIETKNTALIQEQLNYVQSCPIPEKYRSLIEKGVDILNAQHE